MQLEAQLSEDEQLVHFARGDPVLPVGVRSSESAGGLEILFVRIRLGGLI